MGCVRDLVVRGTSVKLGDEARTQDPGSVKQGCQHRWVDVRAVNGIREIATRSYSFLKAKWVTSIHS